MKRKNLLIISLFSISAIGTACTSAPAPAESNGNTKVPVVQNEVNPIANNVAPPQSAATNSAVPGIPNAPANMNVSKQDPTKNAKVQSVSNPAPDNSEITYSLGQFPVETRTFKNNAQLAKVERIQDVANKKTTVKVYLRNGQVKELIGDIRIDPMRALATEILYQAQNAPDAKPEPKMENPPLPAPQSEQRLEKRPAPQKNQ